MCLVYELQRAAAQQGVSIESLVRKASLVSRKLELDDFCKVLDKELNGYSDGDSIPDYRKIRGILKCNSPMVGWIPVMIEDKSFEKSFTMRVIRQSIHELQCLYDINESYLTMMLSAQENRYLAQYIEEDIEMSQFCIMIPRASIYNILARIQDFILRWSLDLEELGILGDDIKFSLEEIDKAKTASKIYNYTNNFSGSVATSQIQQGATDSHMEA